MTQQQPESPSNEIDQPTTPPEGNGLAIASLILGIVSYSGFMLLTGIPAIITGVMSLRRGQKERAMSIAGIILGSIATLVSLLFILLFIVLLIIGVNTGDTPRNDRPSINNDSMPVDSTRT
jgi:MFS family permease